MPRLCLASSPIFAKTAEATQVNVRLELRRWQKISEQQSEQAEQRFHAEIGLLLLLLKDLWTGDLPLGGGK